LDLGALVRQPPMTLQWRDPVKAVELPHKHLDARRSARCPGARFLGQQVWS